MILEFFKASKIMIVNLKKKKLFISIKNALKFKPSKIIQSELSKNFVVNQKIGYNL